MDREDFRRWQAQMGFDRHGGQKATAQALGMSIAAIRIYENGSRPDGTTVAYPRTLDLACAALAMGLKPFSEYR